MNDDPEKGTRLRRGLRLVLLGLLIAAPVAVLVLIVAMFATVLTGLWGISAPVVLLAGVGVWLRRTRPSRRPILIAALVGVLVGGGAMLGEWHEIYNHDRLHDRFVERVCAQAPPQGSTLSSCRGDLQHQSNGNFCEYAAVIVLQSPMSAEELEDYYASRYEATFAEPGRGGRKVVTVIDFHPDSDFRCM